MARHTYNGHPSYNYWNVALWFGSDEGLYRLALTCIREARTRREAAAMMLDALAEAGQRATPDGAPYTRANIEHAMRGLT